MNETEAARLLARAAAFDNRKPSQAAKQAWAAALHDIPGDGDAYAAVARYYGEARDREMTLWIQPHHVREIRARIRAERTRNFRYRPIDRDEPGTAFTRRYRAQLTAAANTTTPDEDRTQLTARPVNELDVGHTIPTTDTPTRRLPPVGSTAVPCPDCNARTGQPCHTPHGRRRQRPHTSRIAAAGLPTERRDTPDDITRRRHASRVFLAQTEESA